MTDEELDDTLYALQRAIVAVRIVADRLGAVWPTDAEIDAYIEEDL